MPTIEKMFAATPTKESPDALTSDTDIRLLLWQSVDTTELPIVLSNNSSISVADATTVAWPDPIYPLSVHELLLFNYKA